MKIFTKKTPLLLLLLLFLNIFYIDERFEIIMDILFINFNNGLCTQNTPININKNKNNQVNISGIYLLHS